jgi:hypothetical protein
LTALPAATGGVDVPAVVHPEVAVRAQVAVEAGEQVLADTDNSVHLAAGEIVLHPTRMPEFAMEQSVTGQRGIQPACGEIDGVTLGHGDRSCQRDEGSGKWDGR